MTGARLGIIPINSMSERSSNTPERPLGHPAPASAAAPGRAPPEQAMPTTLSPMHEALREPILIERARGGDASAYEELVRAHFSRVFGLLVRLVHSPEDAEDLTQECFVRTWKSLDLYRGECAFSSWLYRIAVHLGMDHLRGRARRASNLTQAPQGLQLLELEQAQTPSPSEASGGRELSRAIAVALARLPERLRTSLILRVFQGLEYEEIAKVTRVEPATSRLHVLQARRLLWRKLSAFVGHAPTKREQQGDQGREDGS